MRRYRELATQELLGTLTEEQARTQQLLQQNKRAINNLDGPVRTQLQNRIRVIGEAIEANRKATNDPTIEFALIQQVRIANNIRHTNREKVKEGAEAQKMLKARLDVLGRIISSLTP